MSENKQPEISEQEKKRINSIAVAVIICSIAVITLVILKLVKVISIDAYLPAMALTIALQAGMFWNTRRGLSVFNLCVAVFCLLVFCVTTYIRFFI